MTSGFLSNTVYFVCKGENMFKLLGTKLAPNAGIYILIAAACMIPTVWLPDLKALSVLGVFGFAATLIVTSTIAYVYLAKRCSPDTASMIYEESEVSCLVARSGRIVKQASLCCLCAFIESSVP